MSPAFSLFNGAASSPTLPDNRGLAFGDGLFETLLVLRGEPQWLDEHLSRLQRGCGRLGLEFPEVELRRDVGALLDATNCERAALKILLSRKSLGQRGYRPVTGAVDRLLSLQPLPDAGVGDWEQGIAVSLSPQRLPRDPQLAGLKHLNRLPQVLASRSLAGNIEESLVQDQSGRLVEAIAANLFLVIDGQLYTPSLDECGVIGIVRDKIVDYWQQQHPSPVIIGPVFLADLYAAQEVFITNSLRGITPVVAIGCHRKTVGPVTREIQQYFKPYWYA